MTAAAPAPAWYEDPYDAACVRWWNGQAWTTAVRQHPSAAATVAPPPAPPQACPPPAPAPAPPPPTANAPTAPSIGAALLPPLTPSGSADLDDERGPTAPLLAPDAGARSSKLRLVLVAGLVVALLALAFAAYSSGMIGASPREASTSGATVVEGPDFTLEAPAGWTEADIDDAPVTVAMFLDGPGRAGVGVMRSEEQVEIPDDPGIRQRLIDLLTSSQTAFLTQSEVLGRTTTTLGGEDADLVTLQGVAPDGRSIQAYQVATLHDGLLYAVVLTGSADSVAAAKPDFDAIVASFRFED